MKKRIITLALAAVMTFAFSITAAAAPSPVATTVSGGIKASSLTPETSVSDIPEAEAAVVANTSTGAVTNAAANGFTVVKSVAVELKGVPTDGVVTLKLEGSGFNPGDILQCYHIKDDGSIEYVAVSATGADQVTLTGVTSCSPFIIVKLAPTANTTAAAASATGAKSPKTGLSVDAVLAALADLF